MKVCATIAELRETRRTLRDVQVGFVPTMGALHEGHLSLVRAARSQCDQVFVSIFVNPTQFGPQEDLSRYPRPLDRDCGLLRAEGVHAVFTPSVAEMYPPGAITWVEVEGLSDRLDGNSRPGHFRGVTTVVSKLFHVVQPDVAFFGQKDAAQVAIIRRMVHDLRIPVQIVTCPIVREPDGLAMSSRNIYLDAGERRQALVLSRALETIRKIFECGESAAGKLIEAGNQVLAAEPTVRLDYLEIVDPATLQPVDKISRSLVAVAAYVGTTRLIDNVILDLSELHAS
jgi:pantoate--beta-alanine ligase